MIPTYDEYVYESDLRYGESKRLGDGRTITQTHKQSKSLIDAVNRHLVSLGAMSYSDLTRAFYQSDRLYKSARTTKSKYFEDVYLFADKTKKINEQSGELIELNMRFSNHTKDDYDTDWIGLYMNDYDYRTHKRDATERTETPFVGEFVFDEANWYVNNSRTLKSSDINGILDDIKMSKEIGLTHETKNKFTHLLEFIGERGMDELLDNGTYSE